MGGATAPPSSYKEPYMKLTTIWDWFWWITMWLAGGFFLSYEGLQYIAWWSRFG